MLAKGSSINDVIRSALRTVRFRWYRPVRGRVDARNQQDPWWRPQATRLHGSADGARALTAAVAEVLNLPGSSHDWARTEMRLPGPDIVEIFISQGAFRSTRRTVLAGAVGPRTCWCRG